MNHNQGAMSKCPSCTPAGYNDERVPTLTSRAQIATEAEIEEQMERWKAFGGFDESRYVIGMFLVYIISPISPMCTHSITRLSI